MINYISTRNHKIRDLLSILKLFFMLFIAIAFFQYCFEEHRFLELMENSSSIMLLLAIGAGIVYAGWALLTAPAKAANTFHKYFCLFLLIGLACCCIWITGEQNSNYKFLYLMAILIATIEYGKKEGIFVALTSATITLGLDLLFVRNVAINSSFENDILLSSLFIILAYTLGYYVEGEQSHINRLERLVHVDALTGLYNYRYFWDTLSCQITACQQTNTPLSLILIDIDHFKQYNDMFGHQTGDTVLQQLGVLLHSQEGKNFVAARYNGASFALVMPGVDEKTALLHAEKIRSDFEALHINEEQYLPGGKLTISLGVSVFPDKATNDLQLFDSADEALYRAKFLQRNRVEVYYPILEEIQKTLEGEKREIVASIKTFIAVINSRDNYTYTHVERTVTYCTLYAEATHLSEEDKQTLIYGAYMHDIGKINIDKSILLKTGALSADEWQALKRHPTDGASVIQSIESLQPVLPLILQHHERYDGGGYPGNLAGEKINYLARILTVADSFDAMTSNRPYQPRKTYPEAYDELRRCAGTQFDPEISISFINMIQNYLAHENPFPSAPERL